VALKGLAEMIATLFATVLRWLGGGVIDKVLGHLQAKAASDVERLRIEKGVDIEQIRSDTAVAGYRRDVITAGMAYRAFWVVWLMFAVPLGLWWIAVMADTIFNGALPDVATIPAQLVPWADTIFQNLFYSGGAVAGLGALGRAVAGRR
jgi:hypothetical protein